MKVSIFLLILLSILLNTSILIAQSNQYQELKHEQAVRDIGGIVQFVPASASITTLLIFKDKKGAWQFTKAFVTNLAATFALKYAINKPRPNGATDGHAFPSGHTAVAFQGASFMQRRYGWSYGIPAYAIAGFVAYSRVQGKNNRHDGWDVLAGIVVGVGSTYLFTKPYQQEHLELSFNSFDKNYLIGLTYKF